MPSRLCNTVFLAVIRWRVSRRSSLLGLSSMTFWIRCVSRSDEESTGVSLPPLNTVETGSSGGSQVSPLTQESGQSSIGANPTVMHVPVSAPMIPEWYREKHKMWETTAMMKCGTCLNRKTCSGGGCTQKSKYFCETCDGSKKGFYCKDGQIRGNARARYSSMSILQRPIFNLDTLEKHFDKASGMAWNSNTLVYYKRTMKKSDISTYCWLSEQNVALSQCIYLFNKGGTGVLFLVHFLHGLRYVEQYWVSTQSQSRAKIRQTSRKRTIASR